MMTLNPSKGTCIKKRGGELNITCAKFSVALSNLGIFKRGQHISLRPLQPANHWLTVGSRYRVEEFIVVTETLICPFGKHVLCVIFGVRADYTTIPILYAVTCFVLGGSCLANSFLGG